MFEIPTTDRHANERAGWRVWRCDACRLFHIKAGGVLLTFTPEEYEAFTHAVAGCYFGGACAQAAPDEFLPLPSITEMMN
ncbi:MAG: hypothetical protein MSG64_20035 [Pyrinomonadaceae bacterium MAG19_C2-C3]|nr:hypothetical protein [Pyrinomonadaceae bacterium MAG19_C2-C3]